jgi:hypothetical protein
MRPLEQPFNSRSLGIVLLFCCVLTMSSCAWVPDASFASPDGTARIEIRTRKARWPPGMQVVLVERNAEYLLLESSEETIRPSLSYVFWDRPANAIGLFRCDSPARTVAFDLRTHRAIEFATIKEDFRDELATEYGLRLRDRPVRYRDRSITDEFAWACDDPGIETFYRKHPALR